MTTYCENALKCDNRNCSLKTGHTRNGFLVGNRYSFSWRNWEGLNGKDFPCEKQQALIISEFEFKMRKVLSK